FKKFPSIGEPGAEKILLLSETLPVLALESNGLRVLLRLGFGKEEKSYARSYRSAQEAASRELPNTCGGVVDAQLPLRRHGRQRCKRNHPLGEACPLRPDGSYYRSLSPPRKA